MKKIIIALFLSVILLTSLAGCGAKPSASEGEAGNQSQTSSQENPASGSEGQTPDADIMTKVFEAHVVRAILAQHKNVQENAIYFDKQGNELTSIYIYADNEIRVWENERSYIDIQCRDGFYNYDPDTMDKVDVGFGIEGVDEEDWESRMDAPLEFISEGDEEISQMTESDGRITLTLVSSADADFYLEEFRDEIESGAKSICKLDVDAETYMIYAGETCLQKPDGTTMKTGEFRFSYDVTPYEPSEEMLQIINGTDKTVTLIANPGTEQEKTYVKSCGENGRLLVTLPDGYKKLYKDEACTQESEPSDENGERTLYTVREP